MEKPNVLYILADDLGWGDVSMHGAPIKTPNIDGLSIQGIELTQHYVCPMCTPSRACLLTGRYASRFGPHATVPSNAPVLPDDYPTLATVLRDDGYDTALFGKWHLGSATPYSPNHYGFNTAYGSLAGGIDPYNHRYKRGQFSMTWHRNGTPIEEKGHVTELIVRAACEWIESRDRPWFCYVPFTAVHVPIKPPQEWLSFYQYQHFDDDPLKDASFRRYAAYASHMDHGVGQLLESLARTCQRENTLIIFASDNGAINEWPLYKTDVYPGWQEASPRLGSNFPLRGVKAQLYEGGIRTPTIINWRGRLAPGRMEHPVHIVDWMPTLTALVGAKHREDPHYDGRDIWPLITGQQSAPANRSLFWNFKGGAVLGVRRSGWKLISQQEAGTQRTELFHIDQDPYETTELARDYPHVVAELEEVIREEQRRDGVSARADVTSPLID
jgi:arylsulfatase A-like enzyme